MKSVPKKVRQRRLALSALAVVLLAASAALYFTLVPGEARTSSVTVPNVVHESLPAPSETQAAPLSPSRAEPRKEEQHPPNPSTRAITEGSPADGGPSVDFAEEYDSFTYAQLEAAHEAVQQEYVELKSRATEEQLAARRYTIEYVDSGQPQTVPDPTEPLTISWVPVADDPSLTEVRTFRFPPDEYPEINALFARMDWLWHESGRRRNEEIRALKSR